MNERQLRYSHLHLSFPCASHSQASLYTALVFLDCKLLLSSFGCMIPGPSSFDLLFLLSECDASTSAPVYLLST